MNVVFVTTVKGRTQHLARTLPKNLADNPEAKFVVLDYNDGGDLFEYFKTNHKEEWASGRLTIYKYREDVPFRMAHAKNMAHRLGLLDGADVLVNLDADNFAGPGFDRYVKQRMEESSDCFLWSRMVKDVGMSRGISGRIAVRAKDFILAGGYDEKYETHSPDDKDFNTRLCNLGLEPKEIDPCFLNAVNHNDKVRYTEYPHAARTGEDFNVCPTTCVANFGKVGCGTVWRDYTSDPIQISPVPTRVFGIGLHKTATQSLHAAFEFLGFKSGHWKSAKWAKTIWREMTQVGRSPTLEKCYVLSDLPIPMLFRQLDQGYPGSKFILTVRDECKWLESVRKHWNAAHNKFRPQWDSDAFSNRVHQLLYGRSDFDPLVMLERYRRHNREVMDHFSDRPSDLLVMNIERGDGWKKLCAFLGVQRPLNASFPRVNATAIADDAVMI